jgi:chemotaxis protein methyltransferase CheR
MTTNETSFFRDVHPWQTLREEILPDLFRLRVAQRRLNIWCAACSSGQEPYSLAMLLCDDFAAEVGSWTIRIVATDLSETMLERCKAGSFSQLEVNRGLPAPALMRHFTRHGMDWRIDEKVKRLVEVRRANLVVPSTLPQMGGVDLVLIRNVLIYFDDPTKAKILTGIRSQLKPDGYLMLGSSEVTTGLAAGFARHQTGRTIYFKPSA